MVAETAVMVAVVGVIALEGVWLAVLTWLVWRAKTKARKGTGEGPTEST